MSVPAGPRQVTSVGKPGHVEDRGPWGSRMVWNLHLHCFDSCLLITSGSVSQVATSSSYLSGIVRN